MCSPTRKGHDDLTSSSPSSGLSPYIRVAAKLADLEGENADETTGIKIVLRAIEEPLRQIVANAGGEGAVVVNAVRQGEGDFGYNAFSKRS